MLLKGGAKAVVITSLELDNGGDLVLLGGNKKGEREREGGGGESIKMTYIIFVGEKVRLTYPKIPAPFTGTGDLFTALLLGWSEYGLQVKTYTHDDDELHWSPFKQLQMIDNYCRCHVKKL